MLQKITTAILCTSMQSKSDGINVETFAKTLSGTVPLAILHNFHVVQDEVLHVVGLDQIGIVIPVRGHEEVLPLGIRDMAKWPNHELAVGNRYVAELAGLVTVEYQRQGRHALHIRHLDILMGTKGPDPNAANLR